MTSLPRHRRVVDGLTASVEARTLSTLARHTPPWVSPDMLTVIGLLGAAVTCAGYCLTHVHPGYLWLASVGLAVNWLGDSMDGTLARHRHIERPRYGFFVDHTVDALSVTLVLLGFGLSPFVRFEIACLLLIAYLLLEVATTARMVVDGVFRISFGKLGPTEGRILLVLINSALFFGGNPTISLTFASTTLADLVSVFFTVWLCVSFGATVVQQGRRLSASTD